MEPKKLIGVLIGAAALVGSGLYIGEGRDDHAAGLPRESSDVAADSKAQLLAGLSDFNAEAVRVEEGSEGSRVEAQAAPADRRWVDGRVTLPPGAPTDESLSVVVLGQRHDFTGRDRNARETAPPSPRSWDDHEVLARAHVNGDGSFRFELPASEAEVTVDVDGRHLFLHEPLPLSDADEGAGLVLQPELGGALSGTIELPAGADELPELLYVGALGTNFLGAGGMRASSLRGTLDFELRALPAAEEYRLWTSSRSYESAFHPDVVRVEPGRTSHVRVPLAHGARVRGKVVDEHGAPLAGVRIYGDPGSVFVGAPGAGETFSNDAGEFDLRGLTTREQSLTARLDPYLVAETEPLELHDGATVQDLTIVLQAGLGLGGTITWPDGSPAEGARLTVLPIEPSSNTWHLYDRGRSEEGSARSRDTGAFEIKGLVPGGYALFAELADSSSTAPDQPLWSARVESIEAGASDVALTLRRPAGCNGRVLDDTGAPVDEFTVSARRVEWPGGFEGAATEVEASFENAAGRFNLVGVDAGDWDVQVHADGHLWSDVRRVSVPALEEGTIEGAFSLTRTASLAGRVLDPHGSPVAGVEIAAVCPSFEGVSSSTLSAEDGSFTIPSVGPGAILVRTNSLEWAPSLEEEISFAPGDRRSDHVIRMTAGGSLSGIVYDGLGAPDPDRDVLLQSDGGVYRELRTDANGRFFVEHLAPGTYQAASVPRSGGWMSAGGEDSRMGDMLKEVRVAGGQIVEGETLELVLGAPPTAPVVVHGTVLRSGEPVPRADVMAVAEEGNLLESMRTDTADEEGRFELQLDKPGDYTFVLMDATDYQAEVDLQITIPEVERFELDLRVPGGSIDGRLVNPDGSAPAQAAVWIRREDSTSPLSVVMNRGIVEVQEDGSFHIGSLEAGRYAISATGEGAAYTTLHDIEVRGDESTSNVEIVLPQAGRIEGRVSDSSGEPIAEATVSLRDAEGRVLYRSSTTTDRNGEFSIMRAPVGPVFASAHTRTEVSEPVPVQVRPGETSSIELGVRPGAFLSVTCDDGEGVQERLAVQVRNESGHDHANTMTSDEIERLFIEGNSSAARRIGPLPPGTYTIEARRPDGSSTAATVELSGVDERSVCLRSEG